MQLVTQKLFDFGWDNVVITEPDLRRPPKQLLKWAGNKQRFAEQICQMFPRTYGKYIEPFVGSGAVLGAMAPKRGVAGDTLQPLVELWTILQNNPEELFCAYKNTWDAFQRDSSSEYKKLLASYNKNPNPHDLLFLSRSCYGGIIRFTMQGKMSTPMGAHRPISPESFRERMILWRQRVAGTKFMHASFQETMGMAEKGDVIYCDPPYVDSQSILYGAQAFKIADLWFAIAECKKRGALVALSIDGRKKSGTKTIELGMPEGLFVREHFVKGGSSMLRRFQKKNEKMEGEDVHDRLLLTW